MPHTYAAVGQITNMKVLSYEHKMSSPFYQSNAYYEKGHPLGISSWVLGS